MRKPNQSRLDPGFWIGIILLFGLLCISPVKCSAKTQYDTIYCDPACIQKFIDVPNEKGIVKTYAVYVDEKRRILDIIFVPKETYRYIRVCKENKITPSLGIKLRGDNVVSIVRRRTKWQRR